MSIHQLNIYGQTLLEVTIDRIKAFEPEDGYYLAFSGGKDSVVIKALADMAGVKYDAHYHNTGIDPPELVRFIKDKYPDVIFDTPRDRDGKRVTMWSLIPQKKIPPTRKMRYCCSQLKESNGQGRLVMTGVRKAESARRKHQAHLYRETTASGKEKFTTDNVEDAEIIYTCQQNRKKVLNPILDWTDDEVWEFIKEYQIPYCELYDQGFKRLGCIGCPLNPKTQRELLERYPKYKALYLKAFDEMLKQYTEPTAWQTADDVMTWWISGGVSQDTLTAITEQKAKRLV